MSTWSTGLLTERGTSAPSLTWGNMQHTDVEREKKILAFDAVDDGDDGNDGDGESDR